jgi:hypothetical protein
MNSNFATNTQSEPNVWSMVLRDLMDEKTVSKPGGGFVDKATGAEFASGWPPFPSRLTDADKAYRGAETIVDIISALQRLDQHTVLLSWHDATRGRFTEQRWRLTTAMGEGRCALSGRGIRRGDLVFRAQIRFPSPAHQRQMILATVLDDAIRATSSEDAGAVFDAFAATT